MLRRAARSKSFRRIQNFCSERAAWEKEDNFYGEKDAFYFIFGIKSFTCIKDIMDTAQISVLIAIIVRKTFKSLLILHIIDITDMKDRQGHHSRKRPSWTSVIKVTMHATNHTFEKQIPMQLFTSFLYTKLSPWERNLLKRMMLRKVLTPCNAGHFISLFQTISGRALRRNLIIKKILRKIN